MKDLPKLFPDQAIFLNVRHLQKYQPNFLTIQKSSFSSKAKEVKPPTEKNQDTNAIPMK